MPTATATYADTLISKRAEISDAADTILAAAAEGERPLTDDERERITAYRDECKRLDAQIEDFTALAESRSKFNGLVGRRQEITERDERAVTRANVERTNADETTTPTEDRRSWGQRVIESPEFKAFGGSGTSGKISVPGFLETRAAIDTTTLGSNSPAPLTPLLGAVGRIRTSSGTVEYLTWSGAAAAAAVAEGALKPEAAVAPTPTPLSLTTYAHWKAITRQALEDLPQVRSIVESKLRQGLLIALEKAAAAAINGATLGGTVVTDATGGLSGGIRTAAGEVQGRGYTPDTVLLNPGDFANLDVAAASSSLSGPSAPSAYWGLRPVASADVAAGTAFVGDFSTGVSWFDRGDEAVYLSDSHADYFVRNLLVILAEVRAAFAVTEPAALQEVTYTPVVVGGAAGRK
jgi:HK97 family phage major capsid protein